MTVGNIQQWDNPNTWPHTTTWPQTVTTGHVTIWPSTCAVNLHVWACDHAETCKCALAHRVVAKPACPVCGQ